MASFGLRIYGQNKSLVQDGREWSQFNETLACAILGGTADIEVDTRGRLIVVDASPGSGPVDRDEDGFAETMVVSLADAAAVVTSSAQPLYDAVRARLGDWDVTPKANRLPASRSQTAEPARPTPIPGDHPREPSQTLGAMPNFVGSPPASTVGVDAGNAGADQQPVGCGSEFDANAESAPRGVVLEVGQTVQRFETSTVRLNISDTRLNQLNIGVVGDLGTGKTQLLKSLILQIARSADSNRGIRPRVLIFDYKKDYSSKDFVEAVGAKVVLPYRMPLNLFDTTGMVDSMVPWLDRFKFFSDVLDKIFSGIGPVQRDKLKQAVRKAYEVAYALGMMPTLYDVHAEYKTLLNGKSDAPLAIIDDLVDSEVFTKEPVPGASFASFFDGVVVVSLAALGQDDRSKNMVVAILLNMFYEHMLLIPKRPFLGTTPQLRAIDSYLLVDEADNIMQYEFDVLRKLLLQGREFGVGVVLASQYLRHFKVNATDYREPLLTWFIHKVPNVTASELSGLGLTSDVGELAERVKAMPNHQMLFKTYGPQPEVVKGLPFFELIARSQS
jgi:DNA phosphorothioation-dependent restriction protein DptH